MIVIDQKRIFDEIQRKRPVSVALNGPDGILPKIQETASKITERFGIPAYILADSCFGTCDMNTNGAKVLGADILFHIGHTINISTFGENVVLVDAFDDVSFERIERDKRERFIDL